MGSVRSINVALGLACATCACSGDYSIGKLDEQSQLLGVDAADGRTGSAAVADASVSALLAPADVTFGLDTDVGGPGTIGPVGDIDGDGFGDMAVSIYDFDTSTAYVHLRYGSARPEGNAAAFAFAESGARLVIPMQALVTSASLLALGDVDADGYADFLIDTSHCQPTEEGEGAYLIYGGGERLEGTLSLADIATHFVPPQKSLPEVGCTGDVIPAPTGDLDGDGFADLVLTSQPSRDAIGDPVFGSGEGMYVFYGRSERRTGDVPYGAADAVLHAERSLSTYPVGDIDGDGLADLVLGDPFISEPPHSALFVPGRRERLSGMVDLGTSAIVLQGAELYAAPGDLDGDGRSELVLRDEDANYHLFYGAPGLFGQGVDFARADAVLQLGASWFVGSAGDRDGDGDVELLDVFGVDRPGREFLEKDVAVISGSHERLSGIVSFPEQTVTAQTPEGRFPSSTPVLFQTLEWAFAAGDLDGDGAGDVFSVTNLYVKYSDDGGFFQEQPQLGIHYGTPAVAAALR